MKEQLDIASNSANSARDAIVMTHRPKLIVRELELPELHLLIDDAEDTSANQRIIRTSARALDTGFHQLTGSFRLTNKGTTTATVELMEATIFLGERLPPTNPCYGQRLNALYPVLKAGTTTRVNLTPRPTTVDELVAVKQGRLTLFIIGKLIYTDELKNGRRTGFARRFNLDTNRFERKSDEDYDYED